MNSSFRRKCTAIVSMVVLAVSANVIAASPAHASGFPNKPYGHVYNGASPRCLDSGTPQNAQLWKCSGSIYQFWQMTNSGTNGQIVGNSPLGCLDDGAGQNGSGVVLAPCSTSPHQRWTFTLPYGEGALVNQGSGRCLDADLGTIGQQGTKVQVWDCGGGSNQYWAFEFVQISP